MEHGLYEEDLNQLRSNLRSRRELYSPQSIDWLMWVIYATEVGYNYTGDEYWHSFEEQTPGWEFQDRNQIKIWFQKFQRTYNGVMPSGLWAEHFTIISWPITHAILPIYLQRQFARALYDLRDRLARIEVHDPETIGRLLSVNVHMPTTRFREFLQQEKLIGRIVLALLGEEASGGDQPIYPRTLERIIIDLDKVRVSRDWLKETRRVVSDRFKGIGRGPLPPMGPLPSGQRSGGVTQLAVCPKVLLRHTGAGNWSVFLDVPSFRNLAALSADIHSFLKTTRCRLNGGKDTKPSGWLLSAGNRKGILHSWPDATKPLIQLDRPYPIIDHRLEAECRLTLGPIWLFRVGPDGIARQIIGGTVRPGYNYILVTTGGPLQANEAMSSCTLDCEGATAFRLAMPPHVTESLTSWLASLGLHVARTVRVWPAGLPGRSWDGEGSSEWLTTEAPCFGISHDYPVDTYTLCLNDDSEHLIQTDGIGDPIFIRLPCLPAGIHSLTVKAHRSDAIEDVASASPAEGFVRLTVREPEPWTSGVASHPGLIVTLGPSEPDLDTFWRNEIHLFVIGPENYAVSLTVKLEAADGREIFQKRIDDTFHLPITTDKWHHSFEQFLEREEYAESYLEAARGTLTIDGHTLGSCSIVFEHDVKPVRWRTRRAHNDILIKLIDDTGHEGTDAKVHRCDMERPLVTMHLASDEAMAGFKVEPPGSLFYAEHVSHNDTIVVSNFAAGKGLRGLGFSPNFRELQRNADSLTDALCLLVKWQEARLSGFLVKFRHQQVVNGIRDTIYKAICGQNWMSAEIQFRDNPKLEEALENLKVRVDRYPSFATVLVRNRLDAYKDTAKQMAWFSEVAARYKVCDDSKLCEFAFHLANEPQVLSALSLSELHALVAQILNYPAALRGARLLALLPANDANNTISPLVPGR